MKKLYLLLGFLLSIVFVIPSVSYGLAVFQVVQGGTGTSTPSGILYGDNGATSHLNTVTIGTGLTFSGGTLSAPGGGGGTVTASPQGTFGYFDPQGNTISGSYFGYASSTNRTVLLGSFAGGQNATTSATALYETAVGYNALNSNTTGISNTAFGDAVLQNLTTGTLNTGVGDSALQSLVTGLRDTAVGYFSQQLETAAYGRNSSFGYSSLSTNTTGTGNTALGASVGNGAGAVFSTSTLIGWSSGFSLTSGSLNTFLGGQAGNDVTTGTADILIGTNVTATTTTTNNMLNIGNLLYGSGLYNSPTDVLSSAAVQGLFGISTSSPQATLSVQGNELLSGNLQVANITATGTIAANTLTLTNPLAIAYGGTNAASFTTSGNGVYYNGTSLLTAPTTGKVTYPYASSTAITAANELNLPNGTTVASLTAGDIFINTNSVASSSIAFSAASQTNTLFAVHSMGITLASSSLAYIGAYGASGSTSIVIANPIHSSTLISYYCKTDVGTVYVGFGNGTTATTTETQCTTSGTNVPLSTNNTFAGRQAVYLEVGHEASNPNIITVTADVEDAN